MKEFSKIKLTVCFKEGDEVVRKTYSEKVEPTGTEWTAQEQVTSLLRGVICAIDVPRRSQMLAQLVYNILHGEKDLFIKEADEFCDAAAALATKYHELDEEKIEEE